MVTDKCFFPDPASIMDLLDQMEPQTNNLGSGNAGQYHQSRINMTETMAINAIQKSLMQCESVVVKSPTYTTNTVSLTSYLIYCKLLWFEEKKRMFEITKYKIDKQLKKLS